MMNKVMMNKMMMMMMKISSSKWWIVKIVKTVKNKKKSLLLLLIKRRIFITPQFLISLQWVLLITQLKPIILLIIILKSGVLRVKPLNLIISPMCSTSHLVTLIQPLTILEAYFETKVRIMMHLFLLYLLQSLGITLL